jgi:NAD-dependent dihydropyrimidine dehydrogenase PreA subunit
LRIFQRLRSRPSTIDRPADFTHVQGQGLPAASRVLFRSPFTARLDARSAVLSAPLGRREIRRAHLAQGDQGRGAQTALAAQSPSSRATAYSGREARTRGTVLVQKQGRLLDLTTFTYDLSRCMFCGLCEDACPVDTFEDFELASYSRKGGIWDRQMLEEGPRPMQYP